ncbi:carboxynorspermidine decarboxylase [Ructibacterium gallinarum]|uniref:Carboxynorspermidine decarboxylase n=1 Tax=Ructibacterium gallinarum TaxID=2779355 RepID=A0A9D5R823_9FIRM|nr:carboxynorspermidine decarboxylase [Ructibacterium gallinarum]MBE5039522.1 carboxynorspermidine decarboxylase [Ructibacterium gallinarum]
MREKLFSVETPCYVIDEQRLIENLSILSETAKQAGCKILLAQKAFSMFSLYPLIGKYLDGTTASGLFEARLGHEEMGKETHIFSAAYLEKDFDAILKICDHISFNSFAQWEKYKARAMAAGASCGIRINPEHSTQEHAIYDPCAPGSRLGVTAEAFRPDLLAGIEGLHFHTLCEQNSDALIETLDAAEEKFGIYFSQMKWLNLGGGHHITRKDYDRSALIKRILKLKEKYQVEVYLEPGEAIAYYAGYLVASVLDVVHNGIDIALLDASAACHMPDVLEMPYRPPLTESAMPGEKPYNYRLAGATCLAGDIIGDYSFECPLEIGDQLVFEDMAIYTMVKNNTFNGICLPSIAVLHSDGTIETVKKFGYKDFRSRLS